MMVLDLWIQEQCLPFLDTHEALVRNRAAAGVAQLVEHQLAMLDVAGSNPVSRSTLAPAYPGRRFYLDHS